MDRRYDEHWNMKNLTERQVKDHFITNITIRKWMAKGLYIILMEFDISTELHRLLTRTLVKDEIWTS